MAYTVKELAKLSGVSVRTLHFYDEIDLLKPAYYGENGYRYYEEPELLRLQQILFFRELDFELKQIQQILGRSDYNQIAALSAHRSFLKKQGERIRSLIKTIDKTIDHMKGVKKMSSKEIYQGFSNETQAEYEKYLVDRWGTKAHALIAEGKKNTKDWKKEDYEKIKKEGDVLFKELAEALRAKSKANSPSVQILIGKYYQVVKRFYNPTKEVFIGLGQLYIEHPDFRKFFDPYHPELPEFLAEAMKVYAEKELA